MLNPFPDLLVLGFTAPTLIRVAAAALFLYVAYMQYQRRDEISKLNFPIIGRGAQFAWLAVTFHTVVGAMLFFGYYTQIAALLGIVGLLKGLWLNRQYPTMTILPRSTIFLLIVICASLMLSGAGAFAFDIPL